MSTLVEEVFPGVHRIEVVLPQSPLRALNSYVIRGQERNLIIDTGLNRVECKNAMEAGLRELEIDLRKTDFFITHFHADHSGLVSELLTDSSKVYASQLDADIIKSGSPWRDMRGEAVQNGLSAELAEQAFDTHPGRRYWAKGPIDFTIVEEGQRITVGDFFLECIATPGHTKGQMCLYDSSKRLLFSGDHILGNITPNISPWLAGRDALRNYLSSLDKVYPLDVEVALPGHRSVIRNCRERILELKHHHQERAKEVLSLLDNGGQNAFQVAGRMTWDMRIPWEQFPPMQKWFATGEAVAHLWYLEDDGTVQERMRDKEIVFTRA